MLTLRMLLQFLNIFMLTSTILAAAIPTTSTILPRQGGGSAADQLLDIAPSSGSCNGADFPDECTTNAQAAPFLILAMSKYGITSTAELAAVLSLIAFESGDFKYNKNHFPQPGRPGQGTRAMFMPNYVLLYAKSIPTLSTPLAAITTASTTEGLSDDQLSAIRALVLPNEYSWGSAAWFLTSQCASARPALQAGGQAGFEAYMACVGTEATSERVEYWKRASGAFGLE